MVRVIEGKIIQKMTWGETKIGSSLREFKLSRVRVTEGKITVNVWRSSITSRCSGKDRTREKAEIEPSMYDGNPGEIDFGSS